MLLHPRQNMHFLWFQMPARHIQPCYAATSLTLLRTSSDVVIKKVSKSHFANFFRSLGPLLTLTPSAALAGPEDALINGIKK